ncbi:MAG: hypothetical protein ACE5NC_09640 [Anaerolineae bacterium]
MAHTLIVHLHNADPMAADVDNLPDPADTNVTLSYPRSLDGKPLRFLSEGVDVMILPWHRISFIEVMADKSPEDQVLFYRD